jgi:hypothetical protein
METVDQISFIADFLLVPSIFQKSLPQLCTKGESIVKQARGLVFDADTIVSPHDTTVNTKSSDRKRSEVYSGV